MNNLESKITEIKIYQQFPIMKPFVGDNYITTNPKVIFIGESHYLPSKWNGLIKTEWYSKSLSDYTFDNEDLQWLSTSKIIIENVINSENKNNSHSIYRNLGNVFGEVFGLGNYKTALQHISFYNYFIRPAETTGKSIVNDWFTDNQISFETLLDLDKILQPDKIIFASHKAKKAFDSIFTSKDYHKSKEIDISKIDFIPHPGMHWWNKISKKYGYVTGKDKLIKILNDLKK